MNNTTYHKKGFGLKNLIQDDLKSAYESDLIDGAKERGNTLSRNGVTVKLAEVLGFCWGVDRAVSMAYETRRHFPDRRIWITNEIIHNPLVNSHLKEMKIEFLDVLPGGKKDFERVGDGDVVILPAFGASVEEMEQLSARGCEIVDTTCPWVSRVWNRLSKYAADDFTAVIHGKYRHEETVATSSRAPVYLIVQNLIEAEAVCRYIIEGGDKQEFLARFLGGYSDNFDPDLHLSRVGIANQTTMLKGETEQIGKLFEKTMLQKYGPQKLDEHFLSPGDTICDATQERQDAIINLVEEKLDLMLIIGGFNSSNTGHLHEIALSKEFPAYHIDGPECIISDSELRHKPLEGTASGVTKSWLPKGDITIGISAGASTPNQVVVEVIEKIFALRADKEDRERSTHAGK